MSDADRPAGPARPIATEPSALHADDRARSGAAFVRLGALSGFIAVAAGAFGAHALRGRLAPDMLEVFETAARYQLIHAVALLAVGLLIERRASAASRVAGVLFVAGTVVFSGSLYALALSGVRLLGAITPLGGLCFLAGWLALVIAAGARLHRDAAP